MQIISEVKVPSFMWLIEGTELLKSALTMAFHCTGHNQAVAGNSHSQRCEIT